MELIAIITMNILFLALVVFAMKLDRRVARVEERHRNDVSRLTERVFNVNRGVLTLQSAVEALSPAAVSATDERAAFAERQFVEAIEEIMAYSAPKAADSEAVK